MLSQRARVVFAVQQVWPVCRTVGYFSVLGRKGMNRIRFAGRVGRKRLGPGTYRIYARTLGGRLVQRVTLIVVKDSTPSRRQLRAARAANVCPSTQEHVFAVRRVGGTSISFASRDRERAEKPFPSGPPAVADDPPQSGGVLGASAEEAADAIRPFLIGLLVAAILALGLASLPMVAVPDNRLSDLLARHRLEITTVGAAALVAVAIAFLIG